MTHPLAIGALLLCGAIFGFFYAWICSTMWGLDTIDPHIAITAMQAMNQSVRNAVFAPAFFGTPIVLGLTALVAWRERHRDAAALFAAAGVVYLLGGFVLTATVNVPMNLALADESPATRAEAAAIWQAYSPRWQRFNLVRTIASGIALLLTGIGLLALGSQRRA